MRNEYDFSQGTRGPVEPSLPGKTRITIRLDSGIVNWFRDQVNHKGGGNYQTSSNEALRSYIQRQEELLEETLVRVIRGELRAAGYFRCSYWENIRNEGPGYSKQGARP